MLLRSESNYLRSGIKWLILCLFVTGPKCAWAEEIDALLEQASLETLYTPTGEWQIELSAGYGEWDNPLNHESPQPLYLLPKVRYYSERFYLENFRLGYALFESKNTSLDLVSDLNVDGVYFNQSYLISSFVGKNSPNRFSETIESSLVSSKDYRFQNIRTRHYSYMAGLRWSFADKMRFGAKLLKDITNVHRGYEAQLMAGKDWHFDSVAFGVNVMLELKSARLVDYYYGLEFEETAQVLTEQEKAKINDFYQTVEFDYEVVPDLIYRPEHVYQGHSSLNHIVEAFMSWPFSDAVSLVAEVQYQRLGSGIAGSPLIESPELFNYFIGLNWSW